MANMKNDDIACTSQHINIIGDVQQK